jgi:hypothetical protein
MTLATLLLVDHCYRAGVASAEEDDNAAAAAAAAPLPSAAPATAAAAKRRANPSVGKFSAMALASCW